MGDRDNTQSGIYDVTSEHKPKGLMEALWGLFQGSEFQAEGTTAKDLR